MANTTSKCTNDSLDNIRIPNNRTCGPDDNTGYVTIFFSFSRGKTQVWSSCRALTQMIREAVYVVHLPICHWTFEQTTSHAMPMAAHIGCTKDLPLRCVALWYAGQCYTTLEVTY